jgi:hypothetical protein
MKQFLGFAHYSYVAIFARAPTCWQGDVAAIIGDSVLFGMDGIGSPFDREQPGP